MHLLLCIVYAKPSTTSTRRLFRIRELSYLKSWVGIVDGSLCRLVSGWPETFSIHVVRLKFSHSAGADYILIPEKPAKGPNWEEKMCSAIQKVCTCSLFGYGDGLLILWGLDSIGLLESAKRS